MKRLALLACSLFFAASLWAADATVTVRDCKFALPEGWKSVEPKSSMRKAQLEVPGKDGGKPGEIVFFAFEGGQGGDAASNAKRWFAQFSGGSDVQKSEEQKWGEVTVTLVSTEGTLKASPIAGTTEDQPDFALVGAIVEHAEGPIFVKFTGPAALVKASKDKFVAFVKSGVEKK
jgi:hypothetical protein